MLPAHFFENLGYIYLLSVASNLFPLVFGRNLDAHDSTRNHDVLNPPLTHVYSPPQCLLGLKCYSDAIYLSMVSTFLGVLLSIYAGYRDRSKIALACRTKLASASEVIGQVEAGQWWFVDFKFYGLPILSGNTYDEGFSFFAFSRPHYVCSCYFICLYRMPLPMYAWCYTGECSKDQGWSQCWRYLASLRSHDQLLWKTQVQ